MVVTLVLAVSVLLQFSAAILALKLIRVTGRRAAWALIATAVFLMAVRRSITLFRLLSGDLTQPPDLTAEMVALVISVLMVAGIGRIAPLFHAIGQSEEALRGSQERLGLMVEQAGAILWTTDSELRFTSSQGAGLEALNLQADQIVGQTLYEYFQTDDPEFLPIVAHRRALHGESVTYEQTWNGNTYQTHLEPLRDVTGDIVGVIGVSLDITERKRVEEELKETYERLTDTLESMTDGFVSLNSDWIYGYVNAKAGEMFDRKPEELVGRHIWTEFPEGVGQPFYENYYKAVETQKPISFEDYYEPWDRWFENRVIPSKDGLAIFFQDITERKRAEEALERRAQELAALNAIGRQVGASLSPDQVAQAAMKAIAAPVAPDLALFFLREGNSLFVKAVGPPDAKYHHAETPEHRVGECLCGLAVSQGEPIYSSDIHCDARCTWDECKNAGLRSFAALPLHGADEVIGVLGLASAAERDFGQQAEFLETLADQIAIGLQNALLHEEIRRHAAELEQRVAERTAELNERVTEVEKLNLATTNLLKDLQAASRKLEETARQLQRTNAELETFTYSVSHDLKAPLRGIDGYSRLLLQDYADQLDEEGRTFLHTIRRATEQMNQLIDDLLAYSRLERRSLVRGQVNPRELVETLVAEQAEEIRKRGASLTVELPCQAVIGEAEGLAQALRNLLDNALKFTRGVPEPRIEIGGRETENSCIIWVRDNGIGFDMQYHDRIFEIFQRLHRAEEYPGTGIGLAIVRKAVERMGGRVWAESAPGEGATFYLEIPR